MDIFRVKKQQWDERNSIVFVGYQAEGTLGKQLIQGATEIKLFGETVVVNAQIHNLEGFSGHGDYREMIDYFTSCQDIRQIRKTFIVHGESSAQQEYKDHLYEAGFRGIEVPQKGDSIEL